MLHRDFARRTCTRNKDADLYSDQPQSSCSDIFRCMCGDCTQSKRQPGHAPHLWQVKLSDAKFASEILGKLDVKAAELHLAIELFREPVRSLGETLRICRRYMSNLQQVRCAGTGKLAHLFSLSGKRQPRPCRHPSPPFQMLLPKRTPSRRYLPPQAESQAPLRAQPSVPPASS